MKKKTSSAKETSVLAAQVARIATGNSRSRRAKVLGLIGDLGSGKTTFTKAFARTLGVRRVSSPTFILMRRSAIRKGAYRNFFHIDAYRLRKPSELLQLGLSEILDDPENIVLIEWADKVKKLLPPKTIWIKFEHGSTVNERMISMKTENIKLNN